MNNILACLGKMLHYAYEVELLEVVPRVKLLKIPQQKFEFLTFEHALIQRTPRATQSHFDRCLAGYRATRHDQPGDAGLQ
ncbi:MAG: hypothetical protein ABI548_10540 [Polyangiaceae bacterium]